MQFSLNIEIPPLKKPINYSDRLLLIGSCFTEHIADRLQQNKFRILSNPHGILFNPLSVAASLNGYIDNKTYGPSDLFYLNELWNSWDHHTRFSSTDQQTTLNNINQSQAEASSFIHDASWVIITLGSAFQYYLKESGNPVANNHRAPAQWFEKRLLTINEIQDALSEILTKLQAVNPDINVLFTISPVRHIRDGVTENNRSKARLIEAVHHLCETHTRTYYFPSYELLIDILRDYRYYDIDMVHPNYMGTTYVWEQFVKSCIDPSVYETMAQVLDIATARAHRTRFPETMAHRKFMDSYAMKTKTLMEKYPELDLNDEMNYFHPGNL